MMMVMIITKVDYDDDDVEDCNGGGGERWGGDCGGSVDGDAGFLI